MFDAAGRSALTFLATTGDASLFAMKAAREKLDARIADREWLANYARVLTRLDVLTLNARGITVGIKV